MDTKMNGTPWSSTGGNVARLLLFMLILPAFLISTVMAGGTPGGLPRPILQSKYSTSKANPKRVNFAEKDATKFFVDDDAPEVVGTDDFPRNIVMKSTADRYNAQSNIENGIVYNRVKAEQQGRSRRGIPGPLKKPEEATYPRSTYKLIEPSRAERETPPRFRSLVEGYIAPGFSDVPVGQPGDRITGNFNSPHFEGGSFRKAQLERGHFNGLLYSDGTTIIREDTPALPKLELNEGAIYGISINEIENGRLSNEHISPVPFIVDRDIPHSATLTSYNVEDPIISTVSGMEFMKQIIKKGRHVLLDIIADHLIGTEVYIHFLATFRIDPGRLLNKRERYVYANMEPVHEREVFQFLSKTESKSGRLINLQFLMKFPGIDPMSPLQFSSPMNVVLEATRQSDRYFIRVVGYSITEVILELRRLFMLERIDPVKNSVLKENKNVIVKSYNRVVTPYAFEQATIDDNQKIAYLRSPVLSRIHHVYSNTFDGRRVYFDIPLFKGFEWMAIESTRGDVLAQPNWLTRKASEKCMRGCTILSSESVEVSFDASPRSKSLVLSIDESGYRFRAGLTMPAVRLNSIPMVYAKRLATYSAFVYANNLISSLSYNGLSSYTDMFKYCSINVDGSDPVFCGLEILITEEILSSDRMKVSSENVLTLGMTNHKQLAAFDRTFVEQRIALHIMSRLIGGPNNPTCTRAFEANAISNAMADMIAIIPEIKHCVKKSLLINSEIGDCKFAVGQLAFNTVEGIRKGRYVMGDHKTSKTPYMDLRRLECTSNPACATHFAGSLILDMINDIYTISLKFNTFVNSRPDRHSKDLLAIMAGATVKPYSKNSVEKTTYYKALLKTVDYIDSMKSVIHNLLLTTASLMPCNPTLSNMVETLYIALGDTLENDLVTCYISQMFLSRPMDSFFEKRLKVDGVMDGILSKCNSVRKDDPIGEYLMRQPAKYVADVSNSI